MSDVSHRCDPVGGRCRVCGLPDKPARTMEQRLDAIEEHARAAARSAAVAETAAWALGYAVAAAFIGALFWAAMGLLGMLLRGG